MFCLIELMTALHCSQSIWFKELMNESTAWKKVNEKFKSYLVPPWQNLIAIFKIFRSLFFDIVMCFNLK